MHQLQSCRTDLIARGARMAHRLDGELFVVYVDTGLDDTEANRKSLQANIKFSEDLGAQIG